MASDPRLNISSSMSNGHSPLMQQRRAKLGAIGRSSTLSQSFEISSYPRENIVTCAEYPNPFPKRYYSRRYRQGPGICGGNDNGIDLYKSEFTIPENAISGASDSTPLLRLSSLSSQYNVAVYSQSPPLCSSSAPSEENLATSTPSLHQTALKINDGRTVDRLSPLDANSTCDCQRSPGVLSKTNSNDSLNLFDPTDLSIENRTLNKCTIRDTSKLKSGSTGNLHNSWNLSLSGRMGFERGLASSKTISGSLGSRGIVGAAGLGIGIGAGTLMPAPSIGNFSRELPGSRNVQTTLAVEEDDDTKRNLKLVLSGVGWWGVRIFLYSFYLGVLIIFLTYTYVATMQMIPITVFLIVLSVVLFVFILFCVCFIVFI